MPWRNTTAVPAPSVGTRMPPCFADMYQMGAFADMMITRLMRAAQGGKHGKGKNQDESFGARQGARPQGRGAQDRAAQDRRALERQAAHAGATQAEIHRQSSARREVR